MAAYYNEFDPYAAEWLRKLISAGHIAPGDVDERSILDVRPDDLRGYSQHHFFAGIGVWSYALRKAGWPDDRPVWTGSCPCQPFASPGAQAGFADERHLWPFFHYLIQEHRPPTVFGEQVANKAVDPWLDLVQLDLEAVDYTFGAVAFPSASVGAPHIRDRLFWVGHADIEGLEGHAGYDGKAKRQRPARPATPASVPDQLSPPRPTNGFWGDADWVLCRDEKYRAVEPGTFPLADGVASRVGRLCAYGNAINAEAATEFIAAFLETGTGSLGQ